MAGRLDSLSACVPSEIATALRDIGQWRARAEAMDRLQQHVRGMASISPKDVPALVTFIIGLIKDPNFKISVSAMHLLAHVSRVAKSAMHDHIAAVTMPLLEKFMDGKLLMRQSAHLVFTALLKTCGPQAVLPKLVSHMSHFAWRVREELVNVYITAMLLLPATTFDWPSTAKFLLDLLDDAKQRVRLAALEAFGVLSSKVAESRLRNILMAIDCPPASQKLIMERAQSTELPSLNSEGYVQHVIDLEAASANGFVPPPSYQPPASPYGRLPFAITTPGSSRRGSRSEALSPSAPISAEPSDSLVVPRPRSRRSQRATDGAAFPLLQPLSTDPLDLTLAIPPGASAVRLHRTVSDQLQPAKLTSARASPELMEQASLTTAPSEPSAAQKFGWLDRCATFPRTEPWVPDRRDVRARHSLTAAVSPWRHEGTSSSQESVPLRTLAARRSGAPASQATPQHDRSTRSTRSSGDMPGSRGSTDPLPPVPSLRMSGGRRTESVSGRSTQDELLQGVQGVGMRVEAPGVAPVGQRIASGGGMMHLASAPSSDIMQAASGTPDSPSKADRLRHLKQLQAHRRAQSAGVPSSASAPLSTADFMPDNAACGPVRTFLSQPACEPAGEPPGGLLTGFGRVSVSKDACAPAQERRPSRAGSIAPTEVRRASSVPRSLPKELERVASAVSDATSGSMSPQRQGSGGAAPTPTAELSLDDSVPSKTPEADLTSGVAAVMHANGAKRQELDWVRHNEAIHSLRVLVKHHPAVVCSKLKEVLEAMLPCAAALRSSTLKTTLCFFQELIERLGSKLSGDLEDIVPALLKKAADVSTAGRENFLTQYADAALSQMVLSCSEAPTAKALLSMCGAYCTAIALHGLKAPAQSARLKVAAHLDELLCKSSGTVCKSAALQSQLAKAAVMLLEEGAADTRAHARRMLWSMKRLLPPPQFVALRSQHMAGPGARRVLEAIEEGGGPPEAPGRLAQSFAAVLGSAKACTYCRKLRIPMPGEHGVGNIAAMKAQGPWDGGGLVGKKLAVGGLPPQHNLRRVPSRHKSHGPASRPAEDTGSRFGGALAQPSYITAGRGQ